MACDIQEDSEDITWEMGSMVPMEVVKSEMTCFMEHVVAYQ